jgi:hypothetical protein
MRIRLCVLFSGVMDIVQSIHEGFHNMPKLYGSEVREHGKVTNFTSGLKEGGKVSELRCEPTLRCWKGIAVNRGCSMATTMVSRVSFASL